MTKSIDFRINDFIHEYLNYKGYTNTIEAFSNERHDRKEPINKDLNGSLFEKEKDYYKKMKNDMLNYFDNGNREEFFQLWSENIPSSIIDNDASNKTLEFFIYTHFAIYHIRKNKNDELTEENMQIFKSYIESVKGQDVSQSNEILPLFALPYVPSPEKHASFQDIFSNKWLKDLHTKLSNFLELVFTTRPLPNLIDLFQNRERASHVLTQLNNENQELKYRTRDINRQMKQISTDYCHLIGITMELVETLQQAVVGKTITNEYIDNVCARLGLARSQEHLVHVLDDEQSGNDDPLIENLDYGKIKRSIVHIATSPRSKALLLQALRWKLTKAKTDFKRETILDCYIGCDLLGCRSDIEQRTKIIQQLSSTVGGDTYYVKEEWARFINTIASLRKGRSYLAPNEALIVCMQKAAVLEQSDTLIKQHLLAALQKLSLKRSVQTIMINHNIIKWLLPLLSKTERLSDYTLEYGVALLMNLCLRTGGRRKCAEIAEQAITVLSNLLTHPNQETRPYVNSALYSILTLKSIRDKALQLNLDTRLRTLIRTEKSNSEIKGQLEFLLNLLCKSGDQDGRQTSDTEQENDDEDQDIMEADLDLGDKLRASDKELSGEKLIIEHYSSQQTTQFSPSANPSKYPSPALDPVLQRPITPGQLRRTNIAHTTDSIRNSPTITDNYQSHSNGFESRSHSDSTSKTISTEQQKKSYSTNDRTRSNSNASIHSSTSSIIEFDNDNMNKKT